MRQFLRKIYIRFLDLLKSLYLLLTDLYFSFSLAGSLAVELTPSIMV